MHGIVQKLPQAPRVVADPGAGVGAFTVAALHWWRKPEVHAVDVNVVTLGLLATRPDLAPRRLGTASLSRLGIVQEDFLEWLKHHWPKLEGPRLILGNPPYTRHQQMTLAEKAAARTAAGDLAPGARAGLSTYFFAATLAALRASDSLCLLLPANWLEADYARPVRHKLWQMTNRPTELHLFPNDLNVFPGAQVAAMVVFIGPERKRRQRLKLFRVTGDLGTGFNERSAEEIDRIGVTPPSFSPRRLLVITHSPAGSATTTTLPLGAMAVIRRGVATGANSFFLRTKLEMEALPAYACVPAISRLRDLVANNLDEAEHAGLGIRGARCWLLSIDEESAKDPNIKQVIDEGESSGINERYLCRTRQPWYMVEKIPIPDILIGPMGKKAFRVVVNTVGAIPTNTVYGIKLRYRTAENFAGKVEHLATWLRSIEGQEALLALARNHHGDGLVKLEPGALKQVQVPARIASRLMK
ncbi:Eco57I restriction-modification methylase domain-containing protein [Sphaerisporangium sp. TRM90804]|nr:Eco57I restriction-modification methylase domain-containing protein [Sphaerisporangium sp. TRM90804]MDH2429683.1 Eco57I restriction-modification methylase domain-containing protein [Sphaerisporangium sp. TRM90804]